MTARDDLIYDVGAHNGADSAFYLSQNYKVLAIEASPLLAEKLRARFKREIDDGRYTLLEVGVADEDGTAEFWLSDVTEWSSFDRSVAALDGTSHRSIQIPIRKFASIVEQFGVPHYCKVDIEGNDACCLRGFEGVEAPRYFSIEVSFRNGGSDLDLLEGLGYRNFKIISQVTRAQPVPALMKMNGLLPPVGRRAFRAFLKRACGVRAVRGWNFPWGSSGAFGEDTPGAWHSAREVRKLWTFLRDQHDEQAGKRDLTKDLGEWFDIHATR
jgi:FkbM family methyltransferase